MCIRDRYQLINMENEHVIAKGNCERIGIAGGRIAYKTDSGVDAKEECDFPSHTEAFLKLIEILTSGEGKVIDSVAEISAVGHRVLHGSEVYKQSTLITGKVIDDIESFSDLGPLHNPPQAAAMRACRKVLGPDVPMVAVFDTSFHQTLSLIHIFLPRGSWQHQIQQNQIKGLRLQQPRLASGKCSRCIVT